MLYCKSLSLAAALLVFPALPTTGATAFSRQTIVPHSAPRNHLSQATEPRKAEGEQLLQRGAEQYKAKEYNTTIQT